jgi:hypothetical protein
MGRKGRMEEKGGKEGMFQKIVYTLRKFETCRNFYEI